MTGEFTRGLDILHLLLVSFLRLLFACLCLKETTLSEEPVEQEDQCQEYLCQDGKTPYEIPSTASNVHPQSNAAASFISLSISSWLGASAALAWIRKIPKVQAATGICLYQWTWFSRILRHLQLSDGILCIFHFSQSCLHSFLSLGPKAYPIERCFASSNPSLLHHGMGERRDDVSRMIYQSLEKKNKLKGIFFWATQCSLTNSPWWYSVDCCDVAACYFDFDINLMTVITRKPSPLAWSMAPHLQDQGCQQKVSCKEAILAATNTPKKQIAPDSILLVLFSFCPTSAEHVSAIPNQCVMGFSTRAQGNRYVGSANSAPSVVRSMSLPAQISHHSWWAGGHCSDDAES